MEQTVPPHIQHLKGRIQRWKTLHPQETQRLQTAAHPLIGHTDQPSDSAAHCWLHEVPQETCADPHTQHLNMYAHCIVCEHYLRTGRLATSVMWRDSIRKICRQTNQFNPCAKYSAEQMYLQLLQVPQASERMYSHRVTGDV